VAPHENSAPTRDGIDDLVSDHFIVLTVPHFTVDVRVLAPTFTPFIEKTNDAGTPVT
jgi:hypothetical protein